MTGPGARLALVLCLAGCGAQSFQPRFKPRERPTEPVVLEQVSAAPARDERPVAVGITESGDRLFAWDLSAGLLWERAVKPRSAPLVAGDAIVMQEAAGITVRDLATGEVRAIVDDEGALVGADGHGGAVAVTIAYPDGNPRAAVSFVEGRNVRWTESLNMPVGAPALVNDRVLVPWATQRLSVLDTSDGAELVRWHLNNTVLGHARVDRGRVFVGQLGWMRLGPQLLKGGDAPVVFAPFKRSLPGQPPFLRDGYVPVPEPASAHHRVQLDWRIGTGDASTTAENDLLALRFYRLLFALDAHSDAVRWVRTFDHDLVGAAIEPGGLYVADSAGTLRFLDASGATRFSRDLGRALQVLTIRPGGWAPVRATAAAEHAPGPDSAPLAAAAVAPAALETPLPSMREQLFAAASIDDDRLGAGRAFAVERLSAIPDESVTAHLVDLCSRRKSPQPVQLAACGQLALRKNGGDQVLLALRRRASFLEGHDAPPVGALAQAAAEMGLKQAGPLLLSHLEDPNTPSADLATVVQTLERLEHRPAISAIERFARMHHAEPEGSELAPALFASIHALGALRARGSRGSLEEISRDPLAPAQVRDQAREAIATIDAPPTPAAKQVPSKPEPEADESEEVQTDPRAYSLNAQVVHGALAPVRAKLSRCLAADAASPRSARVSMVVNGEGAVEGVFVTPTMLQACIEPLLREARFPRTRLGRQRITHVLRGPNATEPEEQRKPLRGKKRSKKR